MRLVHPYDLAGKFASYCPSFEPAMILTGIDGKPDSASPAFQKSFFLKSPVTGHSKCPVARAFDDSELPSEGNPPPPPPRASLRELSRDAMGPRP